jgi:hypothetical protein
MPDRRRAEEFGHRGPEPTGSQPGLTMPWGRPLFWAVWLLATAATGIVAGFFLGHALILGRFLDWMLGTGNPTLLPTTYPVFRASAGRAGLDVFYALAGLQVLAGLAFLLGALQARLHRIPALIAGLASVGWPALHYGSGFGRLEAAVLRSTAPAAPEVVHAFLAWNVPIHVAHAVLLTAALVALLSVPLSARRSAG